MKFFAAIVAAAVAVASVSAADCDVIAIAPVVRSADGTACTTKSGFSFLTAKKPTPEVIAKVCPVPECQKVLKDIVALGLGDCTVAILTPPLQLETDLVGVFQKGCASAGGAATAGSGAGAANSTVSTTAPAATKAPAATTSAPAAAGGNSSAATTTTAPAPATPTPAPSAASSVVVASGAVVFAVAASFL